MSLTASDDTIAAIATAIAAGAGSVAIVRVSGPEAEAIGRVLFKPAGEQRWESHRVLYGHVHDPSSGELVDEVLLLLMRAPRSFTRETVVEFHGHGGLVAVQRLLQLVLAAGARRALPGEFSQRAVLHGRLDLTQAEAISELVCARSQRAAQLAVAGLDGGLQQRIDGLRQRLLDQLAELEARVDFEENLPPLDATAVQDALAQVQQELQQLVADGERARLLRDGARVAIVGRPNVGKSSLLNALSRSERAIVTDLPGTTRDLLDCDLVLQGVPITLLDTAGIRATTDRVEQLGIERSRSALAGADAVLLLFELSSGWNLDDQQLLETMPQGVPLLRVGNKADLAAPGAAAPDVVAISARHGQGLELLERELLRCCGHCSEGGSLQLALNQRQCDLAQAAAIAIERSLEAGRQQLPWDFWTIDLRDAARSLGEITGAEISEAVLDRVFSRFCIGK
ncbi:MAG: tRNA uridine-5-carboxymethylaminomethyl(34) synthesis GTPase MnmE [Synechococcus sp. MED-G71]|nr:MAG: tRNA uridine-5-carboxymethylaminomethyl(34) synthesis GTPase MnmE [Synechococcus sp. MED-G71]RPF75988.1 MAG: tRNA uridine-5-carboxymethylaminomethyl(34) synthesis GTPase MnmE [Synechococcus sp. TMED155]